MAKNRMQKFYNPKLYKPPAAASFVQVKSHMQKESQPEPPPAEFGGSKGEEANGVMAMMDLMVKDVEKEMTEMEAEEKDAQSDYEKMMADSTEKRAEDSKLMADKESAKADMEADLETATEDKAATTKELSATKMYIAQLHGECDWLLQYFDQRKEARDSEIDAMGKAKAVLNGADYALLQTKSKNLLKHVKDG